jgi:hypothetical protein
MICSTDFMLNKASLKLYIPLCAQIACQTRCAICLVLFWRHRFPVKWHLWKWPTRTYWGRQVFVYGDACVYAAVYAVKCTLSVGRQVTARSQKSQIHSVQLNWTSHCRTFPNVCQLSVFHISTVSVKHGGEGGELDAGWNYRVTNAFYFLHWFLQLMRLW